MKNIATTPKKEYQPLKKELGLSGFLFLLSDCSMFCFFCLAIFYYLIDFRFSQIRLIALLISGLLSYVSWLYHRQVEKRILLYIILATLSFLVGQIFQTTYNYGLTLFIVSISYMGIGLNIVNHKHKSWLYAILCYAADAIIIIKIYILRVPINSLIQDGSSYNYISVVAVFFFLLSSITKVSDGKKVSIIQAALFIFIAISAYGRGGLVTGFAVLIGMIWLETKGIKSIFRIIIIGALVICTVLAMVFWDSIIAFLISNTRLLGKFASRGVVSEARIEYWWSFIKNNTASVKDFLLGSDPFLARQVDGNLHNSFLQMYSSYGLLFFIVNIIYIFKAYKYLLKENRYYVLLFTVLLLRASFDRVFFHGVNECIYYGFLFIPLLKNRHGVSL